MVQRIIQIMHGRHRHKPRDFFPSPRLLLFVSFPFLSSLLLLLISVLLFSFLLFYDSWLLQYSCYHCYYYHIISSYLHNPSAPEHVVQLQLTSASWLFYSILYYILHLIPLYSFLLPAIRYWCYSIGYTKYIPIMPPRNSLTSSFSVTDANNEVVCPLKNNDGSNCRKRCLGVSSYTTLYA